MIRHSICLCFRTSTVLDPSSVDSTKNDVDSTKNDASLRDTSALESMEIETNTCGRLMFYLLLYYCIIAYLCIIILTCLDGSDNVMDDSECSSLSSNSFIIVESDDDSSSGNSVSFKQMMCMS